MSPYKTKQNQQNHELPPIPSYGALQDRQALVEAAVAARVEAALAHAKGDMAERTAARNRLAAALASLGKRDAELPASSHDLDDALSSASSASCDIGWYFRPRSAGSALAADIDKIAGLAVYHANRTDLHRTDLFFDALFHFATLLVERPEQPRAKLVNRAIAWAEHHSMRLDFAEHHSRERKRLGAAYSKWTWRLTDDAVDAVWPGLRQQLAAEAASDDADARSREEDLLS